eukprot:7137924-Alexandrium_andersonii.AAC.1
MPKDAVLKLRKTVYGLTTAPWAWWPRVCEDLKALMWKVHRLEPCVWSYWDGGTLVALLLP